MNTKRRARVLSAVLLIVLMFSSTMTVFASNILSSEYWDGNAAQIVNAVELANSDELARRLSLVAGKGSITVAGVKYDTVVVLSGGSDGNGNKYYVDGRAQGTQANPYTLATDKYTEIDIAPVHTKAGASSGVKVYVATEANAQALQKVQGNVSAGLLNQANVTPDTGTAMGLLSGVMPMINTLLGLMVVIISIGMTVFSALDIIYLAFPAFRSMIDRQVESGGKGAKTNKDGSTSSSWVTDDARLAHDEATNTNTSPWGPYFKRRVLAYVFLAIILFILLTGNIFAITTLVTNALQGLFNSLGL